MIWTQDGQGGERLCSLKEAGVGAIAVTHAGSDFQLRKEDGTVVGTIAANGLFLTEEGKVRPMQEVDLALDPSQAETSSDFLEEVRGEDRALLALRDIISMQRLRLKMMLTGQRLHGTLAATSQQQRFSDWLHTHQQWRDSLAKQLTEQDTTGVSEHNQPVAG